jgi:hypothetical protein
MVVHAASGSLITFATLFWGFWAVKIKGIQVIKRVQGLVAAGEPTRAGTSGSGLHDYPGIATAIMAVPLLVTGFIPYFRRWQADSGATTLVRLRDLHKVRFLSLNILLVPQLLHYLRSRHRRHNWCEELQLVQKPIALLLDRWLLCLLCAMDGIGN